MDIPLDKTAPITTWQSYYHVEEAPVSWEITGTIARFYRHTVACCSPLLALTRMDILTNL